MAAGSNRESRDVPSNAARPENDMEPPTLETERLVLRPFAPEDAPDVTRHAGDRRIADTTLNIPHPYTEEDARTWLATHAEGHESGKSLTLAIRLREGDDLIGAIGLGVSLPHRQAEAGYWIAVDHWNRGYATEALREILRYGFRDLGLRRIYAQHLTRNPASGRVMEKVGMTKEGVLRQHALKWDRPEDLAWYGILAEEVE
jgi:ribosomal-protein-alanine N-acetyltransferase